MAVNYKQFVRARISRAKFRQILRSFALDLTATQTAALTNLNRNTRNALFDIYPPSRRFILRTRIAFLR